MTLGPFLGSPALLILFANLLGSSEATHHHSPGEPILLSLRLIGGWQEFAGRINRWCLCVIEWLAQVEGG